MIKLNKQIVGITGYKGVLAKNFVKNYSEFSYSFFKGDIKKFQDVKKWLAKGRPNIIIHLAAKVPVGYVSKNFQDSRDVNVNGTVNLLKAIYSNNYLKKNLKWFFFSSTSHVYKKKNSACTETDPIDPVSKYGKTKAEAEKKITIFQKKFKFPICIGRIFSFTNHNQQGSFLVPSIFKKIKFSKNIPHFDSLNSKRDFVHINDICSAMYFLLKKKQFGIFNIGSGRCYPISKIALFFSKKLNKKILITHNKRKKKDIILSSILKIKKIGWKPKLSFKDILSDFSKNM